MEGRSLVDRLRADKQEFWTQRSSYDSVARDLASHVSPFMGRFQVSDANRGDKKHQLIYDSTATGAHDVLTSGLGSGLTNQSQRWLKLKTSNDDLNEEHTVKVWLEEAGDALLDAFNESNTYASLSHIYGEVCLFGTACCIIESDDENVIHCYPLTWGQYAIGTNDKGQVNRVFREFQLSTSQMISKFGEANVSEKVRQQAKRKNWNAKWTVIHAIEPRAMGDRDPKKLDGKNMPWRSVYFEEAKSNSPDVLQESGYRELPVVAPRWKVVGANVYGASPGMDARRPIKRLQSMTKAARQTVALQARPPLQGPDLKEEEIDRNPNGYTAVTDGQEIKPLYESSADLMPLDVLLLRVQDEIDQRMYRPLFTAISDTKKDITKYEAQEIRAESLTQLGPTIGRLARELLARLCDITLGHMFDQGRLPPPPPELEGMDIKPELLGVLAQAQRAAGASASDQVQMKIGAHAATKPEVSMIMDEEYDIRTYADTVGADPRMLVSPEVYKERLEAHAKAQAAQAQSAVVAEQAGAARDMAQAEATAGA